MSADRDLPRLWRLQETTAAAQCNSSLQWRHAAPGLQSLQLCWIQLEAGVKHAAVYWRLISLKSNWGFLQSFQMSGRNNRLKNNSTSLIYVVLWGCTGSSTGTVGVKGFIASSDVLQHSQVRVDGFKQRGWLHVHYAKSSQNPSVCYSLINEALIFQAWT